MLEQIFKYEVNLEISAASLIKIYGQDLKTVENQIERYKKLKQKFIECFTARPRDFFSAPGRTEIAGNHTDHNNGKVIAAGINLDTIAAVASTENKIVTIFSEGFENPWQVDINNLNPIENEKETTAALIRGIAARFKQIGFNIGGFNAVITSDVLIGSGLSSSASVEVLIGEIFNSLFNEGKIDPVTIAKAGQYAENNYFGKPCGLMDQVACAVGGIVKIDFLDPENPVVEKINFNLDDYTMLIVNTGGSHVDLTSEYAAIPAEMKELAGFFGKEVCRQISFDELKNKMPELRQQVGDRAILRAMHFLNENDRVDKMISSLENNLFIEFLEDFKKSGDSSFKLLQNCYSVHEVKEQGISLALALTEEFLNDISSGACRVHGGGFAGTIQVFIRKELVNDYIGFIEPVFGAGSVLKLNLRKQGVLKLI